MRRALTLIGVLALAPGCMRFRNETRVERGPTTRAYERQGPSAPGGVRARVAVQWPKATLRLEAYDLCRAEQVEEFVEERTSERALGGGAASLGMGVTTALVGTGLLLFLPSFSSEPDRSVIDSAGRYGPTQQQWVRGFGITLLIVGVPAVAAGIWDLSGAGVKVERQKREQMTLAGEAPCNVRPALGPVELQTPRGPLSPAPTAEGGVVIVDAAQLRGTELSGATVAGEDARIDAEDWDRLVAFSSCARAGPPPARAELIAIETGALRGRLDAARACSDVPGAPAQEWIATLEQEVANRRGTNDAPPGPTIASFDDAVATYNPTLRFPGDPVEKLGDPEALRGAAIIVRGKVVDFLEANIAVLDVGGRHVWLYLDAERPWSQGLRADQELEAVGVVAGRQEVGALEAPLLRVVWLRPKAEIVPGGNPNPPKQ